MRALRLLWLYLRMRWCERKAVAAAERALQAGDLARICEARATKFSSRLRALSGEAR